MAISDLSLFSSAAFALDNTTASIQGVEQSLASGKQVAVPSDNLVNYAQAQLLSAQSSAVTNDINIGQQVQGSLTTANNALSDVANWLDSATSIASQGSDGTISTSQMATLGAQVQSILQQVTNAANTQYAGAYLFAGSQTSTPPYDSSGNYSGNSTNTFTTFSDGTQIQSTFDGQAIFGNATTGAIGALTDLANALNSGNKTAAAATLSQLQTALASVSSATGAVGVNESSMQTFLTNATNESTTLQTSISNLTDTDVAQAALQQQQLMLQEQALVSMASGLGKISLVNILT
jgi:flagellar hook-associated protein 3 FlgL